MRIRPLTAADRDAVVAIAEGLPQWFTAGGVASIWVDAAHQRGYVTEDGGRAVAFLTFFVHERVAQIGGMGVRPEHHRRGLGRALVARLVADLAPAGVAAVHVATLGDGVDYEPYARTRAFYRAMGFADFRCERLDDPECPERLVLARILA
jgi:GNAT superfamily N-acetyltransferase